MKKNKSYDAIQASIDSTSKGDIKPVTPKEVKRAWRDARQHDKQAAEKIPTIANANGVLPVTAFGFNRICNTFGA